MMSSSSDEGSHLRPIHTIASLNSRLEGTQEEDEEQKKRDVLNAGGAPHQRTADALSYGHLWRDKRTTLR